MEESKAKDVVVDKEDTDEEEDTEDEQDVGDNDDDTDDEKEPKEQSPSARTVPSSASHPPELKKEAGSGGASKDGLGTDLNPALTDSFGALQELREAMSRDATLLALEEGSSGGDEGAVSHGNDGPDAHSAGLGPHADAAHAELRAPSPASTHAGLGIGAHSSPSSSAALAIGGSKGTLPIGFILKPGFVPASLQTSSASRLHTTKKQYVSSDHASSSAATVSTTTSGGGGGGLELSAKTLSLITLSPTAALSTGDRDLDTISTISASAPPPSASVGAGVGGNGSAAASASASSSSSSSSTNFGGTYLKSKNALRFDVHMSHQFPQVDKQIQSGLYVVKRAAFFLKKLHSASSVFSQEVLKIVEHEDSKLDSLKEDMMTSHVDAVLVMQKYTKQMMDKQKKFADQLYARVITPLHDFWASGEAKRQKLVKVEATHALASTQATNEVDRYSGTCWKMWEELNKLKSKLDDPNAERRRKVINQIEKAKPVTKKAFEKYQALQTTARECGVVYQSKILPGVLKGLQNLEEERMNVLQRALVNFIAIENDYRQSIEMSTSFAVMVQSLSVAKDMQQCVEGWHKLYGPATIMTVAERSLPCPAADLEGDAWLHPKAQRDGNVPESLSTNASPLDNSTASTAVDGDADAPLSAVFGTDVQSQLMQGLSLTTSVSPSTGLAMGLTSPGGSGSATPANVVVAAGEEWIDPQTNQPMADSYLAHTTSSRPRFTRHPHSWVIAIKDHLTTEKGLLSFQSDDVIHVIHKDSHDWWTGKLMGKAVSAAAAAAQASNPHFGEGKFPPSFVVGCAKQKSPDATGAPVEKSVSNLIRKQVSGKKKRFQKDGFDLDLSYITPKIIAMGFPSESIEGVYRNPLKDVQRFFVERHAKHYKLYNLCSERSYDANKFDSRVSSFPFEDHNPPPLNMITEFCQSVESLLGQHSRNLAAIHCKAGKGRTGTMIACYLLHANVFTDAASALRFFDVKRTYNSKGVTIPSQIRYVHYWAEVLDRKRKHMDPVPESFPLTLETVRVYGIPSSVRAATSDVWFTIKSDKHKFNSKEAHITPERRLAQDYIFFHKSGPGGGGMFTPLDNDVCFKILTSNTRMFSNGTKLLQIWFNTRMTQTFGVMDNKTSRYMLVFDASQCDKACKDVNHEEFPNSFRVELIFSVPPIAAGSGSPNLRATSPGPNPYTGSALSSSTASSASMLRPTSPVRQGTAPVGSGAWGPRALSPARTLSPGRDSAKEGKKLTTAAKLAGHGPANSTMPVSLEAETTSSSGGKKLTAAAKQAGHGAATATMPTLDTLAAPSTTGSSASPAHQRVPSS